MIRSSDVKVIAVPGHLPVPSMNPKKEIFMVNPITPEMPNELPPAAQIEGHGLSSEDQTPGQG